jgi:hypothetical protein
MVTLDNGKTVLLPPNIHSVPSLLIKANYNVKCGDIEIIQYFEPNVKEEEKMAVGHLGEPSGYGFSPGLSDQYTSYSDGSGQNKVNYVDANHSIAPIKADPESYRPDKVPKEITIDKLHNQFKSL